jgi:hypothetical protein
MDKKELSSTAYLKLRDRNQPKGPYPMPVSTARSNVSGGTLNEIKSGQNLSQASHREGSALQERDSVNYRGGSAYDAFSPEMRSSEYNH